MAVFNVRIFSKLSHLRYKYKYAMSLCDFDSTVFSNLLRNLHYTYPNYKNEYEEVEKKYLSIRAKRKRYRSQLRKMLYKFSDLYLVSLTFTDDVLSSTDEKTRLKYVQRWSKEYTLDYFGCVDYGKKNGREHYHLIVALDTPFTVEKYRNKTFLRFLGLDMWEYGFSSCRSIKNDVRNAEKSLDYAFKSALYSFKSSERDNNAKPFHSRGVDYSTLYRYDLSSQNLLLLAENTFRNIDNVPEGIGKRSYIPEEYMNRNSV